MNSMKVSRYRGVEYAEGLAGERVLQKGDDSVDLIGFCIENGTSRVLLFAENVADDFFDLRSGIAGVVLQKLRNYQIKLALVLPSEASSKGRFGEMVREENRGQDFRVFEDADEARAWLIGDAA